MSMPRCVLTRRGVRGASSRAPRIAGGSGFGEMSMSPFHDAATEGGQKAAHQHDQRQQAAEKGRHGA